MIPSGPVSLDAEKAALFADMALRGITREYPNAPGLVLNDRGDVKSPRELHPAFYGCFDWHSSVHGHWMLVRLLRLFPDLPQAAAIRAALSENLSAANLQVEADYFAAPNRRSFERTYGWAWLLKLAGELSGWQDGDGIAWSRALQPLAEIIVKRYLDFLPKQAYPIRVGTHPNTAFGLAFALDYARLRGHRELEALVIERSLFYFEKDAGYPAAWEPGGADFFSPALIEADLMARLLPPGKFITWFGRFLPEIPHSLLEPVTVSDRSDLQLIHLDGLNLSRAWCMRRIASVLPVGGPSQGILAGAAERHTREGIAHVASGHYGGEHWLASFAVYLLSTAA